MIEFGCKATSASATDTLITSKWLGEFNQEIKNLQAMIKRHSSFKTKDNNYQSDITGPSKHQSDDNVTPLTKHLDQNKHQSDNTLQNKQQQQFLLRKDFTDLNKIQSDCYTGLEIYDNKLHDNHTDLVTDVHNSSIDQTSINEGGASVLLNSTTTTPRRIKGNSDQTSIDQSSASVCVDSKLPRNNTNRSDKARIMQGDGVGGCVCVVNTIPRNFTRNSDTSDHTMPRQTEKMKRVSLSTQSSLYDSGFEDSLSHLQERPHTSLTLEEGDTTTGTEFLLSSSSTVHDPSEPLKTPDNTSHGPEEIHSINKTSSSPSKERRHDPLSLTTIPPPRSEDYCSIQSIASRDSGFCATDDVPSDFLGEDETAGHKSLLEELESVCGDHHQCNNHNLSSSSQSSPTRHRLLPGGDGTGEEREVSPVWYTRFSFGEYHNHQQQQLHPFQDTHTLALGGSLGDLSSITVDSNISGPNTDYLGVDDNCKDVSGRRDHYRRRKLGLFGASTLHTLYGCGARSRCVLEAKEMMHDYNKISERLNHLRTDLTTLTREVRESREELRNLECRASQLVTSASASRVKLSQLNAMRTLEERLQEEWWAAYNPDTLPLHENYIV
ncbi:hypothetical protein Pcinc_019329 [Petrolisthes cinctipes]|uniref:Uncharacterized protein n=1 Tax=Petrolisthes cinctipes TaxID=88211 RepID=A0AAE1KMU0_PETCI|nr:hypothetical protein Pcinc_019329 [Petrolisthes cinctipes]